MTNSQKISINLNPQAEFPVIGVKIIKQDYAEDFVEKGVIHFSNPKIWRDEKICTGLQLDKDEGCFCFSTDNNDKQFKSIGRRFIKENHKGCWKYYEDTDDIVGTCLYGINKSSFKDSVTQYGVRSVPAKDFAVPFEYFKEFDNRSNRKVVIIFDLYRFHDMLIDSIVKLGALKEEIYFFPVYYVNKKVPYYTMEAFPFEYFLKDSRFSKQSELRIIVASNNKHFYKKLLDNNNNVEIGNISSFSSVQDDYDSDLFFSIQENHLLYNLATPIITDLSEQSFNQLVTELYQVKQNILPGKPKNRDELDELAKTLIQLIKKKYGVDFKDDWRLYNVPKNLYDDLPEAFKGLCATVILG